MTCSSFTYNSELYLSASGFDRPVFFSHQDWYEHKKLKQEAPILWVLENAELASVALSAGLATAAGVGMGAVGAVGVPRRLPRLRRARRRFLLRLLPFTFAPVNGWLKRLCAKKSFRMYYYHGLLCCFKIIFLWAVVVSFAAHQSLPVSMYPMARKKICTYIMN